jgi:hypothetical protein
MYDSKLPDGWFCKQRQFLRSVCLMHLSKLILNYYELKLTASWCAVGEVLYFCVIFRTLNWVEVNGQLLIPSTFPFDAN